MDLVRDFIDSNRNLFTTLSDSDISALHKVQLMMIKDFIAFCEKRNVIYFLGGGTSLGAVRHHGFIPWDDDVDMVTDYEGFNILRNEYEDYYKGKYAVEAPNSERVGSFAFMKIKLRGSVLRELMEKGPEYGVFIDVFPIVNAPDSALFRSFLAPFTFIFQGISYSILFAEQYKAVMQKYMANCSLSKRIAFRLSAFGGRILGVISQKSWINSFDKLMNMKPGKKNLVVIPTGLHMYKKECFPRDVYFPPRKGTFEGLDIYLPNKIEVILERFYGDYMTPPPDANKIHHFFLDFKLPDQFGLEEL